MNVLFICLANSVRSQMAEGLARHLFAEKAKVQSAGSNPTSVNPLTIKALSEMGIDISAQRAKSIDEIDLNKVDMVITLCHEEICPTLPAGVSRLHWPIHDPAATQGSDEVKLQAFRWARDDIMNKLTQFKASFLTPF